jgi:hypothetical protein
MSIPPETDRSIEPTVPELSAASLARAVVDEPSVDEHGAVVRRIVVEDDGIGFEQQYADQIVTPFQRMHGSNEYEGQPIHPVPAVPHNGERLR